MVESSERVGKSSESDWDRNHSDAFQKSSIELAAEIGGRFMVANSNARDRHKAEDHWKSSFFKRKRPFSYQTNCRKRHLPSKMPSVRIVLLESWRSRSVAGTNSMNFDSHGSANTLEFG